MCVYDRPLPYGAFRGDRKQIRWDFKDRIRYTKIINFVIDVDSNSLEDLKIHAEDVIKICDRLIEPRVIYTGMGFHIYDDEMSVKVGTNMTKIIEFVKKIENEITEFVDLKIYDFQRILKIPNSLAVYKVRDNSWRLFKVKEVSLEELKNFDYKKYEIK